MFKKEDFRTGDYIILRNGERLIYTKGYFTDIIDNGASIKNNISSLRDFDDRLRCAHNNKQFDIIRIKRPCINIIPRLLDEDIVQEEIRTIWELKEEPAKEMTIEEISEALGYDVKVVKKRG